jgi:hypothetical protein
MLSINDFDHLKPESTSSLVPPSMLIIVGKLGWNEAKPYKET